MSKKILIAEDSSVILNLTKKILMQQNYEIDAAKDGAEVLEKLKVTNYDLTSEQENEVQFEEKV